MTDVRIPKNVVKQLQNLNKVEVRYSCMDFVSEEDQSVSTIINEHGCLGYIQTKVDPETDVVEYVGWLNPATEKLMRHNFGCVSCETWDACLKSLTDMHVRIFWQNAKLAAESIESDKFKDWTDQVEVENGD